MSFGAAIEAHIGADVSDVQAKGQLVETIALRMDAALQKIGLGNLADKSARESAAAMSQIFAAEERLAAFRKQAAFDQLSTQEKMFALGGEVYAQKRQLVQLEQGTVARLEAELAIEQKILQLQELINSAKSAGNSRPGASGAAGGDIAEPPPGAAAAVIERKFGLKDAFKGLLQGVGIAGVQELANALVAPFKSSAESAQKIAEYTEASLQSTKSLIALRQTDAQQLKTQQAELEKLNRKLKEPVEQAGYWATALAVVYRHLGMSGEAAKLLNNEEAKSVKTAGVSAEISAKAFEVAQRQLALKEKQRALDEEARQLALGELSAKSKVVALNSDINRLLGDIVKNQRDALAVEQIRGQLRTRELELRAATKQLQQETNLSEEQQLELSRLHLKQKKGLTTEEQLRLSILQLTADQLKLHSELIPLIQKGYPNLNAAEKKRFDELVKQGDKLGKQIEQKEKLIELTKNQVDAEKEVSKAIESNIAAWENWEGKINGTGRGNAQLSDRELARKIQNVKDGIFQSQLASSKNPNGWDDFFLNPQKLNLQQALAEQNLRTNVRQSAAAFGQDRAFQMFNGLTEQRFAEILKTATDASTVVDQLRTLNRNVDGLAATIQARPRI